MASRLQSIQSLWEISPVASPMVSLDSQGLLATILVLTAFILSGVFIVTEKKGVVGTGFAFVVGLLASVAYGFGGVFLIDAVGVYT